MAAAPLHPHAVPVHSRQQHSSKLLDKVTCWLYQAGTPCSCLCDVASRPGTGLRSSRRCINMQTECLDARSGSYPKATLGQDQCRAGRQQVGKLAGMWAHMAACATLGLL